jgi:hypothetical protein
MPQKFAVMKSILPGWGEEWDALWLSGEAPGS